MGFIMSNVLLYGWVGIYDLIFEGTTNKKIIQQSEQPINKILSCLLDNPIIFLANKTQNDNNEPNDNECEDNDNDYCGNSCHDIYVKSYLEHVNKLLSEKKYPLKCKHAFINENLCIFLCFKYTVRDKFKQREVSKISISSNKIEEMIKSYKEICETNPEIHTHAKP